MKSWILVLIAAVIAALAGFAASYALLLPRIEASERSLQASLQDLSKSQEQTEQDVIRFQQQATEEQPNFMVDERAMPHVGVYEVVNQKLTPLGQALTLTADGWLAMPSTMVEGKNPAALFVLYRNALIPLQRVARERTMGIVYAHVDVAGMASADIARISEIPKGLSVWVDVDRDAYEMRQVLDTHADVSGPVASDRFTQRMVISGEVLPIGTVVYDERARVVGMIDGAVGDSSLMLPVEALPRLVSALVSGGGILRNTLGVSVEAPRSHVVRTREPLSFQRGVIIASSSTVPSVDPKGVSANQLKDGDVIERVEDDLIDERLTLGEVLAQYPLGAQVTIHGMRDGKAIDVPLTLGSVTTSEWLKN